MRGYFLLSRLDSDDGSSGLCSVPMMVSSVFLMIGSWNVGGYWLHLRILFAFSKLSWKFCQVLHALCILCTTLETLQSVYSVWGPRHGNSSWVRCPLVYCTMLRLTCHVCSLFSCPEMGWLHPLLSQWWISVQGEDCLFPWVYLLSLCVWYLANISSIYLAYNLAFPFMMLSNWLSHPFARCGAGGLPIAKPSTCL